MDADTTIYRVEHSKNNPYTVIDKRALEDDRLSYRARGILAYLLSKPDGWEVSITDLTNNGTEGRDAIYSALDELLEFGYVVKMKGERVSGKFARDIWVIYEQPVTDNRIRKTSHGEPDTVKPTQVIKQKPIKQKVINIESPGFPPDVYQLSESFIKHFGRNPTRSEKGLWIKAFREFIQAGITPVELEIGYVETERAGLTIKSPLSIFAKADESRRKGTPTLKPRASVVYKMEE